MQDMFISDFQTLGFGALNDLTGIRSIFEISDSAEIQTFFNISIFCLGFCGIK